MASSPAFAASVVIPTFNRREHLRRAIISAMNQTVPVEIIVMDDGSTDDTADMVSRRFPQVRFQQFKGPNGPSRLRNCGSQMASAPILFPIDDDAEFVSPQTVEQTLADFDDPRIGAVGIPFINVNRSPAILQRPPDNGSTYVVEQFVGAAHAIRRDLFLGVGGYRESLFYMGEEGDLCIRLLNRGYVVRLGRAEPMHHHESPSRSSFRADWYARRNDIWFAFHNVPTRHLPLHLAATTATNLWYGIKVGRALRMTRGVVSGWLTAPAALGRRNAVSPRAYRLARQLRAQGPLQLDNIIPLLPALNPFLIPAEPAPSPAAQPR